MTEQAQKKTDGGPLLSEIFGWFEVKIFNHPQRKRVRLQDLRLGLNDHVHFERVGWGVPRIRLQTERASGIFLQLDLADRFVALGGKDEGQDREQKKEPNAHVQSA